MLGTKAGALRLKSLLYISFSSGKDLGGNVSWESLIEVGMRTERL